MVVTISHCNTSFVSKCKSRGMFKLNFAFPLSPKRSEILGVPVEHLYAMILEVTHDHVSLLVHHNSGRTVKLSGIRSFLTDLLYEFPVAGQVDEPVVAGICNEVGVVFFPDGDVGGGVELVFVRTKTSVHVVGVAVEREGLDAVVVTFHNHQVAVSVDGHTGRMEQLSFLFT